MEVEVEVTNAALGNRARWATKSRRRATYRKIVCMEKRAVLKTTDPVGKRSSDVTLRRGGDANRFNQCITTCDTDAQQSEQYAYSFQVGYSDDNAASH